MDKQIELKAKIGEIQIELEQLQARANQLVEMKNQCRQALAQEMNKPEEPAEVKPEVKTEDKKK